MSLLEISAQLAAGKGAGDSAVDAAEGKYLQVLRAIKEACRGRVD